MEKRLYLEIVYSAASAYLAQLNSVEVQRAKLM
jgi:hypothetical protein